MTYKNVSVITMCKFILKCYFFLVPLKIHFLENDFLLICFFIINLLPSGIFSYAVSW